MVARSPPTRLEAMTDSADTRRQLLDLIDELAVVRGKVTLSSSGREADYYLDLRRVTLDHRSAPLIGDVVLDLLESEGLLDDIDAVGGLTMGADPVGTAVMHRSVVRGQPLTPSSSARRRRSTACPVGSKVPRSRASGSSPSRTPRRRGGSVLTAVDALREAGAEVVAVAVVMDRDTGAKERVEATGIPYLTALTTADLGLD
jgi:orotate phosphoribosyltransferase